MLYRHAIRPVLFARGRDPETVHEEVLRLLAWVSRSPARTGAVRVLAGGRAPDSRLARQVFGVTFPSPLGLAAGFDKNGVAIPALATLGFGFIEVGTITLHPQPGNPRPRLFRLPADAALINRLGFNNEGAAAVAARLARAPRSSVPLGISLGKSRVTPLDEAPADYVGSLELLYPYGDYFAVNISSPNTPGLRELQDANRLDALLAALTGRLCELAASAGRARPKPLLVKVAPDLEENALAALVAVCLARGVNGLIATNTTLAREALTHDHGEAGGLSGRPLHRRALRVVRQLHALAGDRLPIIGCGGIATAQDARDFLEAGATLLQLYTSFIYEGPGIARRLARGLV